MKNNFQSKAVPRGTRTIWRYLSALFILFTFAIGNVRAAETVLFSSFANTTASNYFKDYTVDGKTVSVATSGSISSSSGDYYCSAMGSTPSNNNGNYVELTVTGATIKTVSILITGNGSNKTCQPALLGWEGAIASNTTADYVLVPASQVISNKGLSNAQWHQFDVHGNDLTKVRVYRAVKGVSVAGAAAQTYGNAQTLQFYGIRVELEGLTPVCPSGLTISSKDSKTDFTEGDAIELTASLTAGNGDITYQWYKGGTAEGNKLTGKTTNKLQIASCTTSDAGDYYCVASKTSCSDAVNASAFAITVAADTKCFNMPAITSKPADLASVVVSGGTLSDVSTAKSVAMNAAGLKLDGNNVYLKVSLASASIVEGTKITVAWKGAGSGAGIAVVNENLEHKVIDLTGISDAAGSVSHIFTASEAANYADEFIIHRNASGTGIYVNAITVEDCGPAVVKHTITLDYNDGGTTPSGSIIVADGKAATKPADPTWAHHRFAGWYNGASPYDWTATVSGDLTLTAHWTQLYTVTYAKGDEGATGDAPTQEDKAEGETFTVAANTFEVAGKDFVKWNDGSADYDPDDIYTVGTENIVLTAQWKAEADKYTVIFKDGETTLDTKLFEVGSNPSDADIDKTKPLFAFAAWQKDAADIALDDEFWATVVKDASVTLTARWTKVYAQDADLEGLVESEGTSADWQAYMSGKGYAYSTSGVSLDAKASGKTYENWPYQGLKAKEIGAYVEGRINANKLVIIKLGHMAAAANVSLDGVAAGTATGLDAAEPAGQLNYFYVENESVLRYETTNGGACVLKAITITNPFQVTFNANGGDPVASQYGHPAVTLPDASNGTKSLLGWFDAAEGGNKIGDVGESYTPAADIELFAQWEDVSTDARLASITLDPSTGVWEPAFNPEIVNYTYTMPYGTAAVPQITGATAVNAGGSYSIVSQASAWDETAVIRGVAESGDKKTYNITMKIAPKDGVSIIKVATTGGTNKTVTGLYAGDGDVNLSSSTKMDGGKYIGFSLDGTTLQAGDRINVHTTTAANTGGSHIIFYDNMTDKNELYDTEEIGGTGDNIFEINAAMVGSATAYVYRANNDAVHQWNGYVDFIEVTRAMNPVLTAITIDGRDGEIDALDDKHFSVTIPYEADLAALTVVPTIVRNAAHPTTPEAVISNEGAWILGDNTYRIMDKDGDYNDYTITLDRDVLKHTVSFNTHGGTAVVSELVEDGGYLAAAPADPTKEDYIFQYWSEDEDGAEVDVTTVQINADKEFHAVWVADGAIKLLDGSTVNHTNFITAVTADETVEFQGNTVNYAKFSGTCSGVNSVKDLTRVIAYNATTNKTKIRISAHNNSTSARNILVKGLVEGASAAVDLATIALGNKEDKISDWIEFDNAANRTIYIMVSSSAGDVYFTQVKVVESGETPMKQAGEAGYSLNLNKGRAFGKADDDVVFEGLNIELIGDYTALNSGNLKMNSSSISFAVAAPVTLNVTTANSKTYYVANSASGTDNETAFAGVSEFNLTAGTWFINAGDADVQLTNIAFSAPKCEKPVFTSLADIELCEGDPFTAFNGSATVSDGGTISYQWYNEDDSEISGAIAATYTPSADGKYYVIATNHKAGFADNFAKSDLVTIQHVAGAVITSAPKNVRDDAGNEFTLSVAATGKNLSYEWFTCNEDGTGAVAVDPACTATSFTANVPAVTTYYKVVVSSDCGSAEALAKVEPWVDFVQVSVSENTNWDFTTCADEEIKLTSETTPKKGEECLMANIRVNGGVHYDDPAFNAQALIFAGEYIYRNVTGKPLGAIKLKFTTTVDGFVTVRFADNGNNNRCLRVTDSEGVEFSQSSASNSDIQEFTTFVHAGDIEIMGVKEDHTGENQYVRIFNLAFEKVDYSRAVNAGRYGTICLPNGGVMKGADIFEIAYYGATSEKIFFDQIMDGVLEAGVPYVFLPKEGYKYLGVEYTDALNASAGDRNGLHGFIGANADAYYQIPDDAGNYIIQNNQYREVVAGANAIIRSNRAYIHLADITPVEPALAPGRRRISMGVAGENAAQGIEDVQGDNVQSTKVLINGNLYILRGEKVYDATGRLVK